jgi:superfamily II DNA or RNA helicase
MDKIILERIEKYNNYIHDIYNGLIKSGKNIDNKDLSKIFEYFSCIKLSKENNQLFYHYDEIDPSFKEQNKMTKNDSGIDACNLIDTIVQCKLYTFSLTWEKCSTFFGSQNTYDSQLKKTIVKWPNLIITRNKECKLSANLSERKELFTDITYPREELIDYCNNLIKNPPKIKKIKDENFKLRDYQLEAIDIINKNKNVIISLPTGCGKNIIIIFSIDENKRYLILVPRIILMEQIKTELIKYKPELKNKIQTIGDNNNEYDETKNITICVYNSVSVVEKYSESFDKIFIDEAHHINIPEIYEVDTIEDDNKSIEENENILKDDTEDELKNTTGFNKIIKSFSKYNNNVYLSATIDEIKDFTYYKKDIRDMIDNKYLCDYTIHIPIFSDDPSNKNICEHLLRNYRNIIIYCNSQKEGKKINELLNTLQNKSSEYIDCKTSRTKRDKIIKSYKNGEIPFLVNVRILVEGFDAPITKGVCFIHLPSSKTTIIQIIGRALRLHSLKTYANIILPFLSKEDETSINKFLKILSQNDKRIKKSYESKTEGGYISIEKIKDEEDDKDNEDIEFRYNMIYDGMGILQNGEEIWTKQLEWVKKYIDENDKRPSEHNLNIEIKKHGSWISTQVTRYFEKNRIMSYPHIRKLWEDFINDPKYKKYFLSNEEEWKLNLEVVKKYIDDNNKRPSEHNTNIEIKKYGYWITNQLTNYKNKIKIMSNPNIKKLWEEFINDSKYNNYFLSSEDEWKLNLQWVKKYIDDNKKRPSTHDTNKKIKFYGTWICTQVVNYPKNTNLVSRPELKKLWEEFINDPKYKKYYLSNEEEWKINLERVKKYIDDNNRIPSEQHENPIIKKDGKWTSYQKYNYLKKIYIMSNPNIQKQWEEFINDSKYKKYFN